MSPPSCSVLGHTASCRTPILSLCRVMRDAGVPDGPMVVRGPTGARYMLIDSIYTAAGLTVDETASSGPRFGKFRPGPDDAARGLRGASPARSDDGTATDDAA
jgi:hypothetical protein